MSASRLRQHRHLGVYGVCIVGEQILLIRKARGPFTGLLDLPGGGIEFGEEPEAALRREFLEETGLSIRSLSLRQMESKFVRHQSDDGMEEELHHLGVIYDVAVEDAEETLPEPTSLPDGQDSGGAEWVLIGDIDASTLTPFARRASFG